MQMTYNIYRNKTRRDYQQTRLARSQLVWFGDVTRLPGEWLTRKFQGTPSQEEKDEEEHDDEKEEE